MNTVTYANAVSSIRDFADAKQETLDAALAEKISIARAAMIALLEAVPATSPKFATAQLLAQTVEFPRKDDGYPIATWPSEVRKVAQAAVAAHMFGAGVGNPTVGTGVVGAPCMAFYLDFSGISTEPSEFADAKIAFSTANDYRHKQIHKTL